MYQALQPKNMLLHVLCPTDFSGRYYHFIFSENTEDQKHEVPCARSQG